MKISWQRVGKEVKALIIILVLSVVCIYAFCEDCWGAENIPVSLMIQSAAIWILLAYGNGWINDILDRKISWIHQPVKRLIFGFVAMIGYTTGILYVQAYFFRWLYSWSFVEVSPFSTSLTLALFITTLITAILLGRSFLLSWRQSAINEEKLKRENIQSRFEALKSQVNPHFLFNSLNALTELVYLDQDLAVKFIQQLSSVYRYVLEHKNTEVVELKEEVGFLEKYIFLYKIRHDEGLQVKINLDGVEGQIVPMALQMLVENAIKHNIISDSAPLYITIEEQDGFMVVRNNVQSKKVLEGPNGLGLANIADRYEFLTDKKVEVLQAGDEFMVKLPILKTKKYAGITH